MIYFGFYILDQLNYIAIQTIQWCEYLLSLFAVCVVNLGFFSHAYNCKYKKLLVFFCTLI